MVINYQNFSLQYDLWSAQFFSSLASVTSYWDLVLIDSWYKSCTLLQTPTAEINWIYTPWSNTRSPSVCARGTCTSRWGVTWVSFRTWTDDGSVGFWLCPKCSICYCGFVIACPAPEDSRWGECCDSGKYEPRERSEACCIIEVALLGWDNTGRKSRLSQGKQGSCRFPSLLTRKA